MNNKIKISNIAPQEIQINTGGGISGITNVYVNGVDVTNGTKAYVIVPTKLSELTNDEGFITSETDPTVPSYVKAISLSDINSWNSKQDALVSGTNIKTINNNNILGSGNIEIGTEYEAGVGINITGNTINNTIRSYNDLEDLPTIPTRISQLVNDKGFVSYNTHDLTNYFETSQLKKILPRVSETGTDLTLNDTIEFKMDFDILPSEIQQIRTTGKNIFNTLINKNPGYTYTEGGITETYNEDGSITFVGTANNQIDFYITTNAYPSTDTIIQLDTTQQYTMSLVGNTSNNIRFSLGYNTTAYHANTSTTFTPSTNISWAFIRIANGTTLTSPLTLYPMLEKGSTATSWEPYTGGKPSPNIHYPQEIYATRGNNEINICGKNLIDISNITIGTFTYDNRGNRIITNNYVSMEFIPVSPNTTYTYSAVAPSNYTAIRIVSFTSDKTFINRSDNISFTNKNATFTTSDNTYYIAVLMYKTTTDANVNEISNQQIEKGSTATEYEPYQGNSFPFNLNFPYGEDVYFKYTRTEQGITYYDRIFKNTPNDPDYTSDIPLDYICLRKQHIFRVLSSSDNWTYERLDNFSIFRLENGTESCAISIPFSNYFSSPNIINIGGNLEIYIPDSDGITNLEEFKTFLDNNDVYIMYPTGYPEYIIIDNDALGLNYINLQNYNTAYDGVTHITQINDELPFEITASTFKKID